MVRPAVLWPAFGFCQMARRQLPPARRDTLIIVIAGLCSVAPGYLDRDGALVRRGRGAVYVFFRECLGTTSGTA